MYIAHVFILPLFLGFTESSTISTVEGATDTTANKKSTEDHNDDDTFTQIDTSYSSSTGESKSIFKIYHAQPAKENKQSYEMNLISQLCIV